MEKMNEFFFIGKGKETGALRMQEMYDAICSLKEQYEDGEPYLDNAIAKIEENFALLDYFFFS